MSPLRSAWNVWMFSTYWLTNEACQLFNSLLYKMSLVAVKKVKNDHHTFPSMMMMVLNWFVLSAQQSKIQMCLNYTEKQRIIINSYSYASPKRCGLGKHQLWLFHKKQTLRWLSKHIHPRTPHCGHVWNNPVYPCELPYLHVCGRNKLEETQHRCSAFDRAVWYAVITCKW